MQLNSCPALAKWHILTYMPVISNFLGILIKMFFDDHNPPHFHAEYQGYEIMVSIKTGVVRGEFPPRALRHVLEWYDLHKKELEENWQLAQNGKTLKPIEGLE